MAWQEDMRVQVSDLSARSKASHDNCVEGIRTLGGGRAEDVQAGEAYLDKLRNLNGQWGVTIVQLRDAIDGGNYFQAKPFLDRLAGIADSVDSLSMSIDNRIAEMQTDPKRADTSVGAQTGSTPWMHHSPLTGTGPAGEDEPVPAEQGNNRIVEIIFGALVVVLIWRML